MKSAWWRNLRLFVMYRAGTSFLVYVSISLAFYKSLGFDLGQIGVLYAIQGLAVLVFDLPTGYIADHFGYRRMLMTGVAIQALSYGLLAITYQQWPVYVLQFMIGFGTAVARGADGPLARVSADIIGANFGKYSRAGVAAMGIAEGTASLCIAALAWLDHESAPRIAMGLQALIYCMVLYIPWRMHEDNVKNSTRRALKVVSLLRVRLFDLVYVLRNEMHTNCEARWLLFYGAVIGCTTQTVVGLTQPYFEYQHLKSWQFAICWAAYHFLWAIFSLTSGLYERFLGRWGALASLVILGIVTNAAMTLANGMVGLLIMPIFYFIRGVQMPIILDYMTGVVQQDRRATMLAMQSTVQFGMFSVMNALLGFVSQQFGVRASFGVSLVMYGALGITFIVLLKKASGKIAS